MEVKNQATEIQAVIQAYAFAYGALQHLQENSPLIPMGDQKTGCIGEFYDYLYLKHRFPNSMLSFGGHSEKGWDIHVLLPGHHDFKVQVKTVSAYSTTRTISPIHHGWDELHLVYLNKSFEPEGFWVVRDSTIVSDGHPLKSKKCPTPGKPGTGSTAIDFGDDRIDELRQSISQAIRIESSELESDQRLSQTEGESK